ncbi:helix-turn-helix domain-containing protein [Azospirillum picis]|uniref:Transcriptional regulator with XRE-family HTH domain n=1 Tax=Azospirillum picis TaxID=488438 RepID=A0ABU0MPK0_9PROT|nr:helix-turn-helix transcriptional regulator [Azospirillum picis]MBP2301418.1 transcriptional regulator with XRE-family HTH domain [Azospirillum picis]MDQ0535249.1 transcriptional regulator with XRE-family HTH domain [Azospirillum picis]
MQLTPFGKALRKLRIDRSLLLADMAEELEVSAAFLSGIETGKKSIPGNLITKLVSIYRLSDEEINSLQDAADASARTITLRPTSTEQSRFMTALARRFNELDENEFARLRESIEKVKR